ncbi:MmgE/PrpD family protein [Bradyrhizobium sp. CCGUVB1N3]|uniref:MmgE/PrpD family protein n=1 Tax=Bradyrhizobium sp. CCGUVB1N3 TaxID=2949629 RepID=UPI0020B3DF09|nr:MmgE/PrpD family protein [Bradyrhizobium sp. CCGUVB1N3]MCP3476466.1 MmgE/PrpD family protein [Bradyrhizobium sp. CCGUVB1N3]
MGTTADIAQFVQKTTFDEFDPELVHHVKNVFLSGVGMTLAGVDSETSKAILSYVKECAAPQEVGVIGANFRTSVEYAALANGTTSHTTELEDDTRAENMYSVGVFPAMFALGEKLNVSGRELIEAFVIAWDVASKLAIASQDMMARGLAPWSAGSTIGVAAGAAKLLKLNDEQIGMAVSIAASHAAGLFKQVGSGAHLYESGMAGRNGLASALLAKHGLTGQPAVLECPMGYLHAVAGIANPDLRLGAPFRAQDIEIKKYPCCLSQMHPIDAFVRLIEERGLSAHQVKAVRLEAPPSFQLAAALYHHPKNGDEAKFSLAHSIASSFLDKKPWLDRYTTEGANGLDVAAFRDKIEIVYRAELAGQALPITVTLNDGSQVNSMTRKITEHIDVSDDEILDKYRKCVSGIFSASRGDQISESLLSLEQIPDISELMKNLTFIN